MKTIKVMGVHGLGDHRKSAWVDDWRTTLESVMPNDGSILIEFHEVSYDKIFEKTKISGWESARAIWKLTQSAVGSIFSRQKGIVGDVSDRIKWTAGYVVAWVEDKEFQRQTRKLILDSIESIEPDLILAHSLGTLITYNAFTHPDAQKASVQKVLKQAQYVTLGSQIGNAFVVRNLTPGRIEPLSMKFWYHLYNRNDDVFTAPIRIPEATNFEQINTEFDIGGFADHSAVEYFRHQNTIGNVWGPIVEGRKSRRVFTARQALAKKPPAQSSRKKRRALLVGINEYPNAADRLEGCVNDVFLMSSVLQECGFEPDCIRICLDDRATAKGILSRLEWLVDDPQPGDERVFFYSAHGATIPEYGLDNEPDRLTETLVPWDFDWTPETAITDDQIWMLYSQLPYDLKLAMIFDCCHSGGIHRDGGAKARGITPPDDIRHRAMKWDTETQMWVSRNFARLNKNFSNEEPVNAAFFGESGSKIRIGRAGNIRGLSEREYRKAKTGGKNAPRSKKSKPVGPYLPLIMEACQENEYSYEYRHGVVSYGAFTYSLSSILRRRKRITFGDLVKQTSLQLKDLGYAQEPQILGPNAIVGANVPWMMQK